MKRSKRPTPTVQVASPCPADWEAMTGDERVRFCAQCERPVYNLSAMTGPEIADLIRQTEGQRRCVRFYTRRDGTTLTRDCPVGVRRVRRRVLAMVGGAVAALFGLGRTVFDGPLGSKPLPATMGMIVPPEDVDVLPPSRAVMGEMIPPEDVHVLPGPDAPSD